MTRAAAYAERKNSSALLVVHHGEIVAEHYWRGQTPDSLTNSMSMAKTVVALLVGVALAEGKIGSVEEPAAKYLPEWAGDGRRRISLRQLLEMASGLADAEHGDDPCSPVGRMYLGRAHWQDCCGYCRLRIHTLRTHGVHAPGIGDDLPIIPLPACDDKVFAGSFMTLGGAHRHQHLAVAGKAGKVADDANVGAIQFYLSQAAVSGGL